MAEPSTPSPAAPTPAAALEEESPSPGELEPQDEAAPGLDPTDLPAEEASAAEAP